MPLSTTIFTNKSEYDVELVPNVRKPLGDARSHSLWNQFNQIVFIRLHTTRGHTLSHLALIVYVLLNLASGLSEEAQRCILHLDGPTFDQIKSVFREVCCYLANSPSLWSIVDNLVPDSAMGLTGP